MNRSVEILPKLVTENHDLEIFDGCLENRHYFYGAEIK